MTTKQVNELENQFLSESILNWNALGKHFSLYSKSVTTKEINELENQFVGESI